MKVYQIKYDYEEGRTYYGDIFWSEIKAVDFVHKENERLDKEISDSFFIVSIVPKEIKE